MPGAELTLLLGRLLSDDALRSRFIAAPQEFAVEQALDEAGSAALASLDALAMDSQAISLLTKRYGEVARILPQTSARLGRRMRPLFMQHARAFWPDGHRRHLLDAQEFLRWLNRNGEEHEPLERARLEFALSGCRLRAGWIRGNTRLALPRFLLQLSLRGGRRYELLI